MNKYKFKKGSQKTKKINLQKVMQGNNKTEVKSQPHIDYITPPNLYKFFLFLGFGTKVVNFVIS